MSVFLGVDAGATKTHALLADELGESLALGHAGCGNWEEVGLEGAYAALDAAIQEALDCAGLTRGDITASAFGLAGLDWPSDEPPLREMVDRLRLPGPKVLVNDGFIALRAGTTQPWGVAVIVGTGSAKSGRNRAGETCRTLGLSGRSGADWGDWGGGEDITEAAVAAVAKAYIGLGPPTALSERLVAFAGVPDVASMLRDMTRGNLRLRSATSVVFAVAGEGDPVARDILARSARTLATSANLVIRKLGMEDEAFELVLAGSVCRAKDRFWTDTLVAEVQAVAPRARPVCLDAPPATGGVLLAMEVAGLQPGPAVHARLLETARALEGC